MSKKKMVEIKTKKGNKVIYKSEIYILNKQTDNKAKCIK